MGVEAGVPPASTPTNLHPLGRKVLGFLEAKTSSGLASAEKDGEWHKAVFPMSNRPLYPGAPKPPGPGMSRPNPPNKFHRKSLPLTQGDAVREGNGISL